MKKFSRTIAMVLVLVMLACSFTSCLSYVYRSSPPLTRVAFAIVDLIFLPLSLLALLIYLIINDASSGMDTEVYLTSAEDNPLTDYLPVMDMIYSLSGEELAALKHNLNSIPETERAFSIDRLISLSETERASLLSAYSSLPETEVISSIQRINALSETETVTMLREFNSLSEDELAALIEELKSLYRTNYVATEDYSRKKAYAGLALQY